MSNKTVKKAFMKSVPVMAGYIVLGTGFGILLRSAGYGVVWAAAMSALSAASRYLLSPVSAARRANAA